MHSTPRRTASKIQPTNVVQLADYRKPPPKRAKRVKRESIYELYPLPFFNRKKRWTWDVTPTGNYTADCETGQAFAIDFLKSCEGTNGWASLLRSIVLDMISAGTDADGHPKAKGIIAGFMGVIGSAVTHSRILERLP